MLGKYMYLKVNKQVSLHGKVKLWLYYFLHILLGCIVFYNYITCIVCISSANSGMTGLKKKELAIFPEN